jgi:hypothetical protein
MEAHPQTHIIQPKSLIRHRLVLVRNKGALYVDSPLPDLLGLDLPTPAVHPSKQHLNR